MKKTYLFYLISLMLVSGLYNDPVSAQAVVRGPYLQSPGPSSIIIRWRTDSLTDSRVYYGSTLGAMTLYADSSASTKEHRVKIGGLSPRTKYFYIVGSSTQSLRGPDARMYFTTAPDPANPGAVRFWTIGDFGHGSTEQRDVRDSYLNYSAAHPADFQLWVGDDAYSDGTDQEYQDKVFDTVNCYGNIFMNLPFVPAPGNHDWNSVCPWQLPCNTAPLLQTGPYLNMIDPPTEGEQGGTPSHTKLFYSFDYGDIHFISLNSELGSLTPAYNWVGLKIPGPQQDTSFTSPMIDWLKADLAATTKKWKVAFWHQCPYSGDGDFTEYTSAQFFTFATRAHFNPHLEQYGVDLVLTGHDHNYQRSYLINGLYDFKAAFTPSMIVNGTSGHEDVGEPYIKYTNGPMAGRGTVYVIEGNSSESNALNPINHPVMYWGENGDSAYGSLIVDVDGDRLDGYYLTAYHSVKDHFTILKQAWSGIEEGNTSFDNFLISPNPVIENTTVSYTLLKRCNVKVNVLDLSGRLVYEQEILNREPGKYQEVIYTGDLTAGTYQVKVDFGGEVKSQKVVKTD